MTISNGIISVNDDSHNHVIDNVDGLQDILNNKASIDRTINGYGLHDNISLNYEDVGADKEGAADLALSNANRYTD